MKIKLIEYTAGLFIIFAIFAFLFLAMRVSGILESQDETQTYKIYASFENIGSLKVRGRVSIAGVKIGSVSKIFLDKETQLAKVELRINKEFQIPFDSSASILTAGLIGDNYMGIYPGGDEIMLEDADQIINTQSALVLEDLITEFLFNSSKEDEE